MSNAITSHIWQKAVRNVLTAGAAERLIAGDEAATDDAGWSAVETEAQRLTRIESDQNYSEYTVCVGNDESNYGSECTRAQAVKIADGIQAMIERRFPGINVRRTWEIGSPTPTIGPDADVIDEINQWVSENWSAAL